MEFLMKLKKSNMILLLLIGILLLIIIYLARTEKKTSIDKDMKCDSTYRTVKLG
jgi:uncharacterized membrane protein (Fun14 family)